MNIDGSWNRDRRVAGFGIIVRGNTGNFVAAKYGCLEDAFSPLQAEAMVVKEGLIWAVTGVFKQFIMSDSLQIVKVSKDSSINLSLVGQIVEDIKELLLTITEAIFTDTH